MGSNCTTCCNNIEKKLKQISSEDEGELKIQTNRQMMHNNLSMIVEDAYESQLSQQNSHLGVSMQIQSNTINSITTAICNTNHTLMNFWILDIQERLIIVSNVNEPNLLMKISVTFNEQTEEYCLFEEIACPGSNSTNSSLNSFHNTKAQAINNNTNGHKENKETIITSSSNININVNGPSNSINNTQNISSEQLKFIANKKYHCYPFERQISQFYQLHFEKQEMKVDRINDFQTQDEMHFTIIETWKEILQRVFKIAGIQSNSNVVIINNFLRFARQANQLSTIPEMLLKFVFEKLKVSRFSICSSGVPILKFVNRKNGIVFDILDSGHIYCLTVQEGSSVDSKFRIIYYCPTSNKNEFDYSNQVGITQLSIQVPQQQQQNLSQQASSPPNLVSNGNGQTKKTEYLQKDIIEYLDSLEQDFMKNCFKSRSITINNQCKNDIIISTIMQILNQYYLSITPNHDDSILNTFQPIIPKQPRNTRVFGTADLLKLNVIETISKSRFDRVGPVEIIKQNLFL